MGTHSHVRSMTSPIQLFEAAIYPLDNLFSFSPSTPLLTSVITEEIEIKQWPKPLQK